MQHWCALLEHEQYHSFTLCKLGRNFRGGARIFGKKRADFAYKKGKISTTPWENSRRRHDTMVWQLQHLCFHQDRQQPGGMPGHLRDLLANRFLALNGLYEGTVRVR